MLFDRDRRCRKCSGSAAVVHRPAGYIPHDRLTTEEHMERRCTTCGHRWAEDPLDAEGVKGEGDG